MMNEVERIDQMLRLVSEVTIPSDMEREDMKKLLRECHIIAAKIKALMEGNQRNIDLIEGKLMLARFYKIENGEVSRVINPCLHRWVATEDRRQRKCIICYHVEFLSFLRF